MRVMEIHVVSKLDNSQHKTLEVVQDAGLNKLAESSIRVRTKLISLTSNNLTYARMGTFAKWWDTYPVQSFYPEPYNDVSSWGIVPVWGFAAVQESTIPDLPEGTLLFGFWPTSNAPTDLKLKPAEASGHWIEISEHRAGLMPLYNRVFVIPGSIESASSDELDRLAWESVYRTLWVAGNHLDEFTFPADPVSQAPVHPLGAVDLPWTKEDGDLSKAVVVSLGASTKTGRVFAYFFERRATDGVPLGFLQVTSAVDGLTRATEAAAPGFPSKTVDYKQLASQDTLEWLRQRAPAKIVVLDFGSRDGGLDTVLDLVKGDSALQESKIVILQIGFGQKVLSMEETMESQKQFVSLGKIRYNTSGVQDAGISAKGEKLFFEGLDAKWTQLLDKRHQWTPDLKIVLRSGVSGAEGIEGGWTRLGKGEVKPDEAQVYLV